MTELHQKALPVQECFIQITQLHSLQHTQHTATYLQHA